MTALNPNSSYRYLIDEMNEVAFHTEGNSVPERLDQINGISDHIIAKLYSAEGERPFTTKHSIRGAAGLAYVPSLLQVVTGHPHTAEIATEVSGNFQELAVELCRTDIKESEDSQIIGVISEVSVAGLLWWGVENGFFDHDSYIHFATRRSVNGAREAYHNGKDLNFRAGGFRPRKLSLDVRTTVPSFANLCPEPDSKIVSPADFMPHQVRGVSGRMIIKALSTERARKLNEAAERAAIFMSRR